MKEKIKGIGGDVFEGGQSFSHYVGHYGVTLIEEIEQNFGDYGIVWFKVFKSEQLVAKLNARYVACVEYFIEEPSK